MHSRARVRVAASRPCTQRSQPPRPARKHPAACQQWAPQQRCPSSRHGEVIAAAGRVCRQLPCGIRAVRTLGRAPAGQGQRLGRRLAQTHARCKHASNTPRAAGRCHLAARPWGPGGLGAAAQCARPTAARRAPRPSDNATPPCINPSSGRAKCKGPQGPCIDKHGPQRLIAAVRCHTHAFNCRLATHSRRCRCLHLPLLHAPLRFAAAHRS